MRVGLFAKSERRVLGSSVVVVVVFVLAVRVNMVAMSGKGVVMLRGSSAVSVEGCHWGVER